MQGTALLVSPALSSQSTQEKKRLKGTVNRFVSTKGPLQMAESLKKFIYDL